ncbi:transcriptional regulator GcvA [Brucellaceae bacterium C25G]
MNPVLPLLGLRAFVETGRHNSIKAAAEAMGVTSGAISQQIKQLEDRLGVILFTRTRYGVRLTEVGLKVYPSLLFAFDQIAASLETLEAINARPTLTISTVPSFAASWLVPRLGNFTKIRPDIEVRVEATSSLVDLQRDRVDVAIRHGLGKYPGLVVQQLMAPVLLPVASPSLLAAGPKIRCPADCLAYPLLQDSDRADWCLWLNALGLEDDQRAERGAAFEDDYLLIRAAIAGQGIALVRDVYASEEIKNGHLVLALDQPWPTKFAYYALTLPSASKKQNVQDFVDWLKIEAEQKNS